MMDKNRTSTNRMRRMDAVVVRDWCGWLNQESFLKAYNMIFIYRAQIAEVIYMGVENHGYSSGEWTSLNHERKKINEL